MIFFRPQRDLFTVERMVESTVKITKENEAVPIS